MHAQKHIHTIEGRVCPHPPLPTIHPRRARSLEWEKGASGKLEDEKSKMINGVHCGIMNELYLGNTLSSGDCQQVSILIWEKLYLFSHYRGRQRAIRNYLKNQAIREKQHIEPCFWCSSIYHYWQGIHLISFSLLTFSLNKIPPIFNQIRNSMPKQRPVYVFFLRPCQCHLFLSWLSVLKLSICTPLLIFLPPVGLC